MRYPGISQDIDNLSLLDICCKQWLSSVQYATNDLSQIDEKRVFTLKYEDLVKNPECVIAICNFIGIKNSDSVVKNYLNKVNKTNIGKWRNLPMKEIETMMSVLKDELSKLNYIKNNN